MFYKLSHPKMSTLALAVQEQFGHWYGFEHIEHTRAYMYYRGSVPEHPKADAALTEWVHAAGVTMTSVDKVEA
jgi:hypothetical protein